MERAKKSVARATKAKFFVKQEMARKDANRLKSKVKTECAKESKLKKQRKEAQNKARRIKKREMRKLARVKKTLLRFGKDNEHHSKKMAKVRSLRVKKLKLQNVKVLKWKKSVHNARKHYQKLRAWERGRKK